MDTVTISDITLLQLRQYTSINNILPDNITNISQINGDLLYLILIAALPLAGYFTSAALVRKAFPSKLPTNNNNNNNNNSNTASARYYILSNLDSVLKANKCRDGKIAEIDNNNNNNNDNNIMLCPSTPEMLMYPTAATNKTILSWLCATMGLVRDNNNNNNDDNNNNNNNNSDEASWSLKDIIRISISKLNNNNNLHHNSDNNNKKNINNNNINPPLSSVLYSQRRRQITPSEGALIPIIPFHCINNNININNNNNNNNNNNIPHCNTPGKLMKKTIKDMNNINKTAAKVFGAPVVPIVRGMVFSLSQIYSTLSYNNNIDNININISDEESAHQRVVGGIRTGNNNNNINNNNNNNISKASTRKPHQPSINVLTMFFDSDISGLKSSSGLLSYNNNNNNNIIKEDKDGNKSITTPSDNDNLNNLNNNNKEDTIEEETIALDIALTNTRKQNKDLKNILKITEIELNNLKNNNQISIDGYEAEQQNEIQNRRDELNILLNQLKWMENYEETEEDFKNQIKETKAFYKTIREDLNIKIEKINQKRDFLLNKVQEAEGGRNEVIMDLRQETKKIKTKIREKEKEISNLTLEYNNNNNNNNNSREIDRSFFMKMISKLSSNVHQQQNEVNKIKMGIHKSNILIENLSSKMSSLFIELEEQVYEKAVGSQQSAAAMADTYLTNKNNNNKNNKQISLSHHQATPGDLFAKEAFKLIVIIRELYENIRNIIITRGSIYNELHVLEETSKAHRLITEEEETERVSSDVVLIREENAVLSSRLGEVMALI